MTRKSADNERVALFAGSFNPFTRGHLDILRRGLNIFDRVVVCVGYNVSKTTLYDNEIHSRLDRIRAAVGNNPRVEVAAYSGLTVDAAKHFGAVALLRGVRSVSDFDYESRMADINRKIAGIDTVMLLAAPEWASVSSSVVRELEGFGYDVSAFLPDNNELQK